MIRNMVERDIKSRYQGSLLGIVWSILNPIALIATYYFVFSIVLKIRLGPQYGNANFTVWLISGLLPWICFSEILSRSSNIILSNSSLITKTQFPSQILPFINLVSCLFNHIITIAVLLFIGVALSIVKVSLSLLLIVPFMIIVAMFGLGLSWIISSINVYLRDVEQIVGIVINLWFYFTPIIYPMTSVPEKFRFILKLNPFYFMADGYRNVFLNKLNIVSFKGTIYSFILAIIVFILGGFIFKKLKSGFGDVL